MAEGKDGRELLQSVLEAHGGLERWKRVQQINLKWLFHGALLEAKGFPGNWTINTAIQAQADEPSIKTTGLGHGEENESWHLLGNQRVWIEDAQGTLVKERLRPREGYGPNPTRAQPWSDLDLTYFVSYAIFNYLTAPFVFTRPGFSVRELAPHQEPGYTTRWRTLEVTHPDDFPAHNKVQRYYYDEVDFLLRRLDYKADVIGAFGAHYVYDYKRVGGLAFPTLRRVLPRDPNDDSVPRAAPTSLGLRYVKVEVVDVDGQTYSEAQWVNTA